MRTGTETTIHNKINKQEAPEGYEYIEAGIIPKDWDIFELSKLSHIETGSTPPTSNREYYGNEFMFVSPVDLGKTKWIFKTEKYLSKKGFNISRKFPAKSILVACIGSTIGKIGMAATKLTSNQQINAIFPNNSILNDFLYYQLSINANKIKQKAAEQAVPILNKTKFGEIKISVPPRKEQTAIATALSDADNLIESLEKLIAKKQDIKKACMQQLLTGKKRLPGFEGEWETFILGNHVKFLKTGSNSRSELSANGSIKYIHYGDIHTNDKVKINASMMGMPRISKEKVKSLSFLMDGDLIFVDASEDTDGVGKSIEVSHIPNNGVVAGLHTIAARFDKTVLADGFKAYLQFCPSFKNKLRQLAAGTKVFATSREHIKAVEIRLPDTTEQTAIAKVINDMDNEIEALERRLEKTKQIKQGMMQELLTGRTRLINQPII